MCYSSTDGVHCRWFTDRTTVLKVMSASYSGKAPRPKQCTRLVSRTVYWYIIKVCDKNGTGDSMKEVNRPPVFAGMSDQTIIYLKGVNT